MDADESKTLPLQSRTRGQEIASVLEQEVCRDSQEYGGRLLPQIREGDGGALPRSRERIRDYQYRKTGSILTFLWPYGA